MVSALLTDRQGRLWVGTYGGGINVLERRDPRGRPRFRRLGIGQGLSNENINMLLTDLRGQIWASTGDGLALIDPASFEIRNLRRAEGVQISNYWTGAGAVEMDASRRLAAYTNLPPGNYRLHLRGSNRNGDWSAAALTVPISVLPAWYRTVAFKVLASVALLGLLALAYQLRIRSIAGRLQERHRARLAQALWNAWRHARANEMTVFVSYGDRELLIRIGDDGRGIAPGMLQAAEASGHFGLAGMRERARGMDARLHIESSEGGGTRVEIRINSRLAYVT